MINNDLKIALINFRNISNEIINSLQAEDFEKLEILFKKRQDTIDAIEKLNYLKEEFISISKELSLAETEKKIGALIILKRNEIKTMLNNLNKSKNVSQNYRKGFSAEALYFNKKI